MLFLQSCLHDNWEGFLQALHRSEKRADQLVAQCDGLENQLRSRDALLLEIKEEASKSAEALRFASQIKKVNQLSVLRNQDLSVSSINRRILTADNSSCYLCHNIKCFINMQDLNDSRQQEVELRQRIERQASYVEDLEQQLKENSRAVRAELVRNMWSLNCASFSSLFLNMGMSFVSLLSALHHSYRFLTVNF